MVYLIVPVYHFSFLNNLFGARSSPQEKSMVFANVGKAGSRICPGLEHRGRVIATRSLFSRKFDKSTRTCAVQKNLAGMNLALDTCVEILRAWSSVMSWAGWYYLQGLSHTALRALWTMKSTRRHIRRCIFFLFRVNSFNRTEVSCTPELTHCFWLQESQIYPNLMNWLCQRHCGFQAVAWTCWDSNLWDLSTFQTLIALDSHLTQTWLSLALLLPEVLGKVRREGK